VRLTLGYAALFVVSTLALFVLTSALLLGYMRERDRAYTRARLDDFAGAYARAGVAGVARAANALRSDDRGEELLVRVSDRNNRTLFLVPPEDWSVAEFRDLALRPTEPGARVLVQSAGRTETVEVVAVRLADGVRLEAGMSSDERDDVVESFPDTFIAVSLPTLLLALLGGAFMGQRAVRPVRRLSETMRSIIETGNVGERAPRAPARGEIGELYRLFDLTFDRVEALIAGLRNTLDDVAHDLRTPLTRIRGVAEVALHDGRDEEGYREALADVVEASESASATLDAIIDVGEAEAGARELRLENVSVGKLLFGVSELYADAAEVRGVSLVVDAPDDIVVPADRALLGRVVANLVDNAVKYGGPGGHVVLGARQDEKHVLIEVRDDGPGIPAADLPRIWDRHFRSDGSRSERGLGLGLSLVRAGVEAHGGYATVHSVEGEGATFTVHLRRAVG